MLAEDGSAEVICNVALGQAPSDPPDVVEQSVRKALGQASQLLERSRTSSFSFGVPAGALFTAQGGRIKGTLDLRDMAIQAAPFGIGAIDVWIFPPRADLAGEGAPRHYQVSASSRQPIHYVDDIRSPGVPPAPFMLLGLLLVPILLVLWQRRRALRASADCDAALVWYNYWRPLQWIVLASWVAWPSAFLALIVVDPLSAAFAGRLQLYWVFILLPPLLLTMFCHTLSQEVYFRLAKAPRDRQELVGRTLWGLLTVVTPLFLTFAGLGELVCGEYRGAVGLFLVALLTRIVGAKLAGKEDLAPYAVATGDLRDRVFCLANRAGIRLRQLYILPSGKTLRANACAMLGGKVEVADRLLANLSKREVDAVLAHELAHLQNGHTAALLLTFVAVTLAQFFLPGLLTDWLPTWSWWPSFVVLAVGTPLVFYFVSRRVEKRCDSFAAGLTEDPEALITALVKLNRLNLMPLRWGRWHEPWLTHPSTWGRAQAIAREHGMSPSRLEQIVLEAAEAPDCRYELPRTDEGEDRVFSSRTQRNLSEVSGWASLAALMAIPAFSALLAGAAPEGPFRWVILAGGLVGTASLAASASKLVFSWGMRGVARHLQHKLSASGIDVREWQGELAGFAPDSSPRMYEHFPVWDLGYLFVTGDRLCYVGEETRFALTPQQIVATRLVRRRASLAPGIYISWQDTERGTEGTFRLHPDKTQWSRDFRRRLDEWRRQAPAPAAIAKPLAELLPPANIEVPSTALRGQPLGAWLVAFAVVFLGGFGASVLLGLPLAGMLALGWYVPAAAGLVVLMHAARDAASNRGALDMSSSR
jgi:STE24 endopeptidase